MPTPDQPDPFRDIHSPSIEELDEMARTRSMPVTNGSKPRRLITREEHTLDMVICGILMFALGFLAAAITFAALR